MIYVPDFEPIHYPGDHECGPRTQSAVRLTVWKIQCPCGAWTTVPKTWQFLSELIIEG